MPPLQGFFKHRALLIIPPLAIALFWPRGEVNVACLWAVGMSIFFLGLLGRIWAQEHLHFRLKMPVTLTTTGPYAIVRNPIYIFNTLICAGLTVLSGNVWLVIATIVWCAILYHLVVLEEEEHIRQYGEAKEEYFEQVSRWLPSYRNTPLAFTNEFLKPSIAAETHNFLFLLPFLVKELLYFFVW